MVVIAMTGPHALTAEQLREQFAELMAETSDDLTDEAARLSKAHLLLHDALQNG